MNVPPVQNPRAYATHLLLAYRHELEGRRYQGIGRPPDTLATIKKELARRAAAIPKS